MVYVSAQRYNTSLYSILRLRRIVSDRYCAIVYTLPYGERICVVLFPELEWRLLVENLLECLRKNMESQLTVKQCGKPSLTCL